MGILNRAAVVPMLVYTSVCCGSSPFGATRGTQVYGWDSAQRADCTDERLHSGSLQERSRQSFSDEPGAEEVTVANNGESTSADGYIHTDGQGDTLSDCGESGDNDARTEELQLAQSCTDGIALGVAEMHVGRDDVPKITIPSSVEEMQSGLPSAKDHCGPTVQIAHESDVMQWEEYEAALAEGVLVAALHSGVRALHERQAHRHAVVRPIDAALRMCEVCCRGTCGGEMQIRPLDAEHALALLSRGISAALWAVSLHGPQAVVLGSAAWACAAVLAAHMHSNGPVSRAAAAAMLLLLSALSVFPAHVMLNYEVVEQTYVHVSPEGGSPRSPGRAVRATLVVPADADGVPDVCAVCLGGMRAAWWRACVLACGHAMHRRCVRAWFAARADMQCPLCRLFVEASGE